jgi:hypothetical protein
MEKKLRKDTLVVRWETGMAANVNEKPKTTKSKSMKAFKRIWRRKLIIAQP